LSSALPGNDGIYLRIHDAGTQHSFNASRYIGIDRLPRVADVALVGPDGRVLAISPPDLEGCSLQFVARGVPHGDVYRVEVSPDPTVTVQEIEQMVAGEHVKPVQQFSVGLRRKAVAEVALEIYRVDKATARRDVNSTASRQWNYDYTVR